MINKGYNMNTINHTNHNAYSSSNLPGVFHIFDKRNQNGEEFSTNEAFEQIKGMKTKMHKSFSQKSIYYYAAVVGFAFAAFFAQVANANPIHSSTPAEDYRAERARCLNGQSHQDTQTCLQEAGAAYQEKKYNRLDTNGHAYIDNSIVRCETFKGEDKIACQARSMGFGYASGSVEGGGVLTSVETVVVPEGEPVQIQSERPNPIIIVPQ